MEKCKILLFICVLTSIVLSEEVAEEPTQFPYNPVARLNEELSGPERTYDHQAWRAIGPSAESGGSVSADISENWKTEDIVQEPPRRRRPGRKRKRRPQVQQIVQDENGGTEVQDSSQFNMEERIKVSYENPEEERPRQRRPQRIQDEYRRGSGEERPYRRRGHRRRQRPYIPDLGVEPSANGDEQFNVDSTMSVNSEGDAEIRVTEDEYKVTQYGEELSANEDTSDKINEQVRFRSQERDPAPVEEVEESEDIILNKGEVMVDKSYRKPYSQAKKQEAEEAAMMGGSAALKDLLKQSGGLSLSEVLQQRNLSLADLLTGKQYALSALKPTSSSEEKNKFNKFKEGDEPEIVEDDQQKYKVENIEEDKSKRRRLPPVNREQQSRIKSSQEDKFRPNITEVNSLESKRRLPPGSVYRRTKPKPQIKENIIEPKEVLRPNLSNPRKSISENIIKSKDDVLDIEPHTPSVVEETENITTEETVEATTFKREKSSEELRNRLSLKPRLRLPSIKTIPKRMSNVRKNITDNLLNSTNVDHVKKAPIPVQAIPISIKDMFGMAEIVSVTKPTPKPKPEPKYIPTSTYRPYTRLTTRATTLQSTPGPVGKISAKDEILEVLTDTRGGEKLTKILAERNMTLKELVEHRERGSSQVHLADIFHNTSKEPNPGEPFLAKSMIEPISKQIYPLKALLEGNMREPSHPTSGRKVESPVTPPMFVDFSKTSQDEENLGIVTLFDKFSEFVGHPKVLDVKDIKKDSDGSSYFTSVISVKPTDEIYRESRSEAGFHNSHKKMSEIYSSIPTYINTDGGVDAKVVQDWNAPHKDHKNPIGYMDKDMDGDGVIVLDDLQKIEEIDNHLAQASNQMTDENFKYTPDSGKEFNFYTRLPAGVRSAIIVSSAIVGTSLIVFLAIFIACRWRQKRRNMLRYEDSFTTGRVKSPILEAARKTSKNNSSSRSISPILTTGETAYRNQKINTMDSQTQRDAQDYLWDSLRKTYR